MFQAIRRLYDKLNQLYRKQKLIHFRSYNYDPVKSYDVEQSLLPNSRHNVHYWLPFLVICYVIFDSAFILLTSDYQDVNELTDLFSHKIFPRVVWREADIAVGTAFVMGFFMFAVTIWAPHLEQKFFMIVQDGGGGEEVKMVQNGKVMDKCEATQIYKFHLKFERFYRLVCTVVYIDLECFYLSNIFLNWTNSARDYIYTLCVIVFFIYGTFINILTVYYFVITTRYIQIKQKLLIGKLQDLTSRAASKRGLQSLWFEYRSTGERNLRLYREIHGNNRFWNKYLALYFFCYVIEVCYLCYMLILSSSASGSFGIQQAFFATLCTEFLLLLLWVTAECSAVLHNQSKINKLQRKFATLVRANSMVTNGQRLKFDQHECNQKWIRKIGFTLLESYQINSQMFEMLFSYISSLFMFILQHKR